MAEIGAINTDTTNLTLGGANAATGINRGSFFSGKNEAESAPTVDMSFDDVLDMVNPLEHIPAVSAIYRAVTGEKIHPVARIAGDALYGAVFGPVSAGLSAIGAIGDEAFAANSGDSAAGAVVAALFGKEAPTATTQLAEALPTNVPAPAAMQVASLQTPAKQSPILDMPALSDAPQEVAANDGIKLASSKAAYGGVMDSNVIQNAQQNQQLALAVASQNEKTQTQRMIRNSRFAVAPALADKMPTANAAPTTNVQPEPSTQAAMQNLIKELQAMKGANSYKNAAQMTPMPGATVNTVN